MARDPSTDTLTGLTAQEAKEFHRLFMLGFIGFTVIAIVAHFLVWSWRPWFPGVGGYAELQGAVEHAAQLAQTFFG
ncbi:MULTISPECIES: light-harvesting antenna LH1, beta subunit [Aquidulcibacter]|jgi:light-harvesting complex 1 beta chain|uniref:light-harvesting antenna LH1, beta subunit n=1 Tax=Aquidulcibacter TaxID=2052989 RepID=UPI000A196ADE|nr:MULTISPECIES: light-harvesting antenna LH1, beta subunit [Aquidulcibacter]MCA3692241.1 light-harvesting protein [Aquidulcibacter sp.]